MSQYLCPTLSENKSQQKGVSWVSKFSKKEILGILGCNKVWVIVLGHGSTYIPPGMVFIQRKHDYLKKQISNKTKIVRESYKASIKPSIKR